MKPYALAILLLIIVVLILLIFAETKGVVEPCKEDLFNCNNFTNQSEAQRIFNQCPTDINQLDNNNDGIACESLTTAQ